MPPSIINSLFGPKGYLRRRWIVWSIVVVAGMLIAFLLDQRVLSLVRGASIDAWPGDVGRTLESFKEFGQITAIVVACLLILVLDRTRRKMLPWLIIGCLLSFMVWPAKWTIHRLRPRHIDYYQTTWGLGFFTGEKPPPSYLPISLPGQEKIVVNEKLSSSDKQSFPSGHTATAFAFAVGLSAMYPAARIIFYALAAGCGAHRLLFDAHWFSDVLAGAFIGLFLARAVWLWGPGKKQATETAQASADS